MKFLCHILSAVVTRRFGAVIQILPWVLLLTAELRADEFDNLRIRYQDAITGGTNLDLANSTVKSRLSSMATTASNNWTSLDKSPTRTNLWSDAASTTISSHISTCFSRLLAMATAWATRGCVLQGNTNLANDILGGLDWMYANRYNETKTPYDNWWDWEIGSPQRLNDTVVLMYETLSPLQLTNYLKAVDHFNDPGASGWMTGANTTDKCLVTGIRGLLGKSSAKMITARDRLSPVFPYVTSGDGFYRDGSFVQHTRHPYTGSYGSVLIDSLGKMLWLLSSSSWQVTDSNQTNLYNWIYDSYEPIMYKGATADYVRGRAISRSGSTDHSSGAGHISSILRIAQFAPTNHAAAFRSMLKSWMIEDTFRNYTNNVALNLFDWTRQLMADTNVSSRGEIVRQYQFANMDRVMHRRPGFAFAISMSSSRIYTYESINSENLHGWFTGDGMTYFYNDDLGQFSGNFWPTIDPHHLPGTTVEQTNRANGSGQSQTTGQSWVGGAVLSNTFGAVGMALDAQVSTLVGKKSWFLFDNEIVCLGSGITCGGTNPVHTTIENRRFTSGPTNLFTINGAAMATNVGWSSNVANMAWCSLVRAGGYFFPGGCAVKAVREARTNSWSEINAGGPTTLNTERFLRLWIDHGAAPTNAAYAYVVLPNANSAATAAYAVSPDISILANTTNVHAVKENSLGMVAANFWTDGNSQVDFLTINRKASVVTRETNNILDVAVSDPTQTNTAGIVVTLNRSADQLISGATNITVLQLSPQLQFSVNTSGAKGQTFQARFALATNLVVQPDIRSTAISTPILINVLENDSGPQPDMPLSLISIGPPSSGVAVTNGNLILYTPQPGFNGVATLTYTITDGVRFATTNITINVGAPALMFTPTMVSASTNDGNLQENTVDGNLGTRWSASGVGQWLQYDLLSPHNLDAVSIAFYAGNTRVSYLNILAGNDGTNWTSVYYGQSSGSNTNLERFECTNRWARYVRVVGNGNSVNAWNSYTEVEIHTSSNSPPFAVTDMVVTNTLTPVIVDVLANDSDPDVGPQPLTISTFEQPAWGGVTATNGSLRYTPPPNFSGVSAFPYAVSDGVLTATGIVQITINANVPPTLAALSNCLLIAGQTLRVTNVASDANVPPQLLAFQLLQSPPGADLNATNGRLTWRPTIAQSPSAYAFRIAVSDDGSPSLSATQSFTATVNAPILSRLGANLMTTGQFSFQIQGDLGPDYTILASSNLIQWAPLLTTNPAVMPWRFYDTNESGRGLRFYRTQLGP